MVGQGKASEIGRKAFLKYFVPLALLTIVHIAGIPALQHLAANELQVGDLGKKFFHLCDTYAKVLNSADRINPLTGRPMPFYSDSYVVRALLVAHDLTGREEYLKACKTWSDRMIAFQEKMIPRGAYYMNYNRAPSETSGEWFNGDSGSIGMGVLATAVRCPDAEAKSRYLNSVESYAGLVMGNYIGPNGGIRNGLWKSFDGEWWCCSGTFGALALLLYDETGKERYLEVGLNALNWLSNQDLATVGPITLAERGPTIPWYVFEPFSAGFSRLQMANYPAIEDAAKKQISWFVKWAQGNLNVPPEKRTNKYDSHAGSKWGGIPFHIYTLTRIVPHDDLRRIADKELEQLIALLFTGDKPAYLQFSELTPFAMISMAEKISPGTIFRNSRTQPKTASEK